MRPKTAAEGCGVLRAGTGVREDGGLRRALGDETRSLHQLAADHETPKGANERIRTTWFDTTNSEALQKALDGLLSDLK
ncbi:hypothetical protein ACIQM4_28435 [Streptomyces sp. NPDC091272]|uniref:hypothetical protein n=1 Tax=Streptomyces sp. NPDC091272 TaxID=3365981 RepID=UPI00382A1573